MSSVNVSEKAKKKSFSAKLVSESAFRGRYMGGSPYQAASKALTEILRRENTKEGQDVVFCLKEITQRSANKRHFYRGRRVKLSEPVSYMVGGNEIRKEFKNEISKLTKSQLPPNSSEFFEDLQLGGGYKHPLVNGKVVKGGAKKTVKKVTAKVAKKSASKSTKKSTASKSTKKSTASKSTKKATASKSTKKATASKSTKKSTGTKSTKKSTGTKSTKKATGTKSTKKTTASKSKATGKAKKVTKKAKKSTKKSV